LDVFSEKYPGVLDQVETEELAVTPVADDDEPQPKVSESPDVAVKPEVDSLNE
jgi:hypothetical protein